MASPNRQQRRAAKHKGKRPGETYADVLARKKMIQEEVVKSVRKKCARPDWRMRPTVFSSRRMIRMHGKEVSA